MAIPCSNSARGSSYPGQRSSLTHSAGWFLFAIEVTLSCGIALWAPYPRHEDCTFKWIRGPWGVSRINRPRQGLCLNTRPSFLRVARNSLRAAARPSWQSTNYGDYRPGWIGSGCPSWSNHYVFELRVNWHPYDGLSLTWGHATRPAVRKIPRTLG